MNLHSFTLGFALLASASAIAQEAPPRPGAARTPSEEIKLLPPEEVAKLPPKPGQQADGKRLPQPDNPLDPNRPAMSDREPAKIRPAEHGAVPAENAKKVPSKAEREANAAAKDAKDGKDAKGGKDAKAAQNAKATKEPAKIRPAENAAVPAENTDKAKGKQASDKQANDKQANDKQANDKQPNDKQAKDKQAKDKQAKDKQAKDKQAKDPQSKDKQASQQPAPRRAVPMLVDGMPSAQPPAAYGPRLTTSAALSTNAPTNVPTTSLTPPRPATPAIVNSCDAGGCTDTRGVRYNGAAGGTMIGPGGKACHNTGVTMQC